MNLPTVMRRQRVFWLLVFGLWSLLVLASSGQLVFGRELSWTEALRIAARDWFPWIFLAPAAGWLAFRFPLERNKLLLSVPVHVVGCLAVVLIYELLAPLPLPGRPPFAPGPAGRPFREGPPPPWFAPEGPPRGPFSPPSPNGPAGGPGPRPLPGDLGGLPQHTGTPYGRFFNQAVMRARFNLPIYWVIVSIAHALTYYRRSEERQRRALELEARLSEAKVETLRMQLHPHFLFNTLNAISTLVHRDPDAADEMIGNLSELLRVTLDTSQQEIPLRQELAFLDRYLEIQQVRFPDHLRLEREIEAGALEVSVPPLILQPLVENSIRHGIEQQVRPGMIRIEAKIQDQLLTIAVRDNGPGVRQAGAREGVGLANTRARLEQLYGPRARLTLKSGSQSGCSVELQIPLHAQNQNADRG
jgi:hypothetical protein